MRPSLISKPPSARPPDASRMRNTRKCEFSTNLDCTLEDGRWFRGGGRTNHWLVTAVTTGNVGKSRKVLLAVGDPLVVVGLAWRQTKQPSDRKMGERSVAARIRTRRTAPAKGTDLLPPNPRRTPDNSNNPDANAAQEPIPRLHQGWVVYIAGTKGCVEQYAKRHEPQTNWRIKEQLGERHEEQTCGFLRNKACTGCLLKAPGRAGLSDCSGSGCSCSGK